MSEKFKATILELLKLTSYRNNLQVLAAMTNFYNSDDPVAEIADSTPLQVQRASSQILPYHVCVQLIDYAKQEQNR